MTTTEMIAVLHTAESGKPIQSRRRDRKPDGWFDDPNPTWNFRDREYRVRPEPREFWIVVPAHPTLPLWVSQDRPVQGNGEIVHVREVLD